jgi:hypothetical protein
LRLVVDGCENDGGDDDDDPSPCLASVEALVECGREIILAGDLNACSARIDSCDPSPNFEDKFTVCVVGR